MLTLRQRLTEIARKLQTQQPQVDSIPALPPSGGVPEGMGPVQGPPGPYSEYGRNPAYLYTRNENMAILDQDGFAPADFFPKDAYNLGRDVTYKEANPIVESVLAQPIGSVVQVPSDPDNFYVAGIGSFGIEASKDAANQFAHWLGEISPLETPFSPKRVTEYPQKGFSLWEHFPPPEKDYDFPGRWHFEYSKPIAVGNSKRKSDGKNINIAIQKIPKTVTDFKGEIKPFDWKRWQRKKTGLPTKLYDLWIAEQESPSSSEYYAGLDRGPTEQGLLPGPGFDTTTELYKKQAGDEDPKREWVSQALPVPQPEKVASKPVAPPPPKMTQVLTSTVGEKPKQIVGQAGIELLKQQGKLTPETQQQNLVNRVQNIGMALRDNITAPTIPVAPPTPIAPVQTPRTPSPAATKPTISKFEFQHPSKQPFYNLLNLAKGNPAMAEFAFNQAKNMWGQFDQQGLIPSGSTFSDHVLRQGVPLKTFTNWAMGQPEYHQAGPALTGRI
jgi:hypothetical protein